MKLSDKGVVVGKYDAVNPSLTAITQSNKVSAKIFKPPRECLIFLFRLSSTAQTLVTTCSIHKRHGLKSKRI